MTTATKLPLQRPLRPTAAAAATFHPLSALYFTPHERPLLEYENAKIASHFGELQYFTANSAQETPKFNVILCHNLKTITKNLTLGKICGSRWGKILAEISDVMRMN